MNTTAPIGDFPVAGGYQCPACNQWVMHGSVHICPTQFNPALPLPALPAPQVSCNAHLFALTADTVRFIVREELERWWSGRSPSEGKKDDPR